MREIYTAEVKPMSIKGYARILYTNYRARTLASNKTALLPDWDNVSSFVRNEFMQEARQLLRG